jgi:aspartate--ammonia ligase
MRAIRKDYFLDHDHSCYVDQWDWEKVIGPTDRTLGNLKQTVRLIWSSLIDASDKVSARWHASESAA